ncbi:MaoC/PaaZ C-terminal domain-containing protein [Subtercola lobariae]|uniref:MaoC-like domain-containing protein n=1 Tax=Subtercola lobariae TaxID=1588641 RepID=A0A917EX73_9MICO|nr:MaoC/PaaZ C-terminal domain-containing protein [Subtercola lobariae]GGF18221.1 hypothetical protein GCM10011399_09910 [Subtercola lobariae]
MSGASEQLFTRDSGTRPQAYDNVLLFEELGPIRVEVTDERVKEYAFSVDDYRSWHFTDSPFGGPIAHATLLSNDLLNVYTAVFDRHDGVAMHVEEELAFHAPVPVGETVTLRGHYVDKHLRRGLGLVIMESEARDSSGKLLVSHRGGEVTSITPGAVAGRSTAEEPTDRIVFDALDVTPITKPDEGILPGSPIQERTKKLSQAMMAVFSFIGENELNFHNDLQLARSKDLPTTIAQGLQTTGFMSEICTDFFGVDWFTSGRIKAKYINPAYQGSSITISGKVAGQERAEDGGLNTRLELWAKDQDGRVISVAWASATTRNE